MDRLETMRLFTRIVERRSFTKAAADLGIPRATVSRAILELEERLGARLLQRTTRHVRPTLDGEGYYRRCAAILTDIEEAEGVFSDAKPKGLLRINVQGTLARHFVLPTLPRFFAKYPDIALDMSEDDRWVDVVQEGVDCVLRFGHLPDSDMVARRISTLERLTCASPDYLERFGMPVDPDSLDGHQIVGIRSLTTGSVRPMQFLREDGSYLLLELPAKICVTGPESYLASARLGLGLVQVPRFHVQVDLDNGLLVQVLTDWPPEPIPISLLYPRNRQLSPRVRAFIDWVVRESASGDAQETVPNSKATGAKQPRTSSRSRGG